MNSISPGLQFNREALSYAAARPDYPEALFDWLGETCRLQPGDRVLEIGAGTGQATEALARRGYTIHAIEPGPDLAALARERVHEYPNANIHTRRFEDGALPEYGVRLVIAATSFHWIDPTLRFSRAHAHLESGGYLAIIHTEHVSDGRDDRFFAASQPIYQRFWPQAPGTPAYRLPSVRELKAPSLDLALFREVGFQAFPRTLRYSADRYVTLLRTFSPILALSQSNRAAFLAAIHNLISSDFQGEIVKHVAMTLTVARKIAR